MKRIIYWKSFSEEFPQPVKLCDVLLEYIKSHSLKEIDKDYYIIAIRFYERYNYSLLSNRLFKNYTDKNKKLLEQVEDFANSKPNFDNTNTTIQNYYLMITDAFVKDLKENLIDNTDEKDMTVGGDDVDVDDDEVDADDGDDFEEIYIDEIDKQILDNIFMLTFLCLAGELHCSENKMYFRESTSIKKYPSRIKQLINKKFTLNEALIILNIMTAVFLIFGLLARSEDGYENVVYEEWVSFNLIFNLIFNENVFIAAFCLLFFFAITLYADGGQTRYNSRRFIFGVVLLLLAFGSGYMSYFTYPSNRFERIYYKMKAIDKEWQSIKNFNLSEFKKQFPSDTPQETVLRNFETVKQSFKYQDELQMRYEVYKAQYDFMLKRGYQENGAKQLPFFFGILACAFFIYAVLFLNFKLFNDCKFLRSPLYDKSISLKS